MKPSQDQNAMKKNTERHLLTLLMVGCVWVWIWKVACSLNSSEYDNWLQAVQLAHLQHPYKEARKTFQEVFPALSSLDLSRCKSIKDCHLETIASSMPQLEELRIGHARFLHEPDITDSVHFVALFHHEMRHTRVCNCVTNPNCVKLPSIRISHFLLITFKCHSDWIWERSTSL